jgi:hypothetical protein
MVAAQKSDLQIHYTGRLFGYYRMEPDESVNDGPDPYSGIKLSTVRAFLRSIRGQSAADDNALILGMGDNFAPEFGAGIQQEFKTSNGNGPCEARVPGGPPVTNGDSSQWHRSAPEVLYKSEIRKPALADCDNVIRFLVAAGYRVIVPGREDFIYSAAWLRRIAFLLKGTSDPHRSQNPIPGSNRQWTNDSRLNTKNQLQMLSANLRVKTSDSGCPLLFSRDLAEKDHPCLDSSATVTAEMDWENRLMKTLESNAVEDSFLRQARYDMRFREQAVENQVTFVGTLATAYGCEAPKDFLALANDSSYAINEQTGALELTVESEHAGKASGKDLRDKAHRELENTWCQVSSDRATADSISATDLTAALRALALGALDAISEAISGGVDPKVALSPDLRQKAVDLFLNLIYQEQENTGFTIAHLASGRRVLVMGVVGQETMQQVSKSNFQLYPDEWDCGVKNADKKVCETKRKALSQLQQGAMPDKVDAFEVHAGDPHVAASTLLRAVWAARARNHMTHPSDPLLFDSVVLMAQMPPVEAQELAEHIRYDFRSWKNGPRLDVVISEAQNGRETPNIESHFESGTLAPVLVPPDASLRWQNAPDKSFATATLWTDSAPTNPLLTNVLTNQIPDIPATHPNDPRERLLTAARLLKEELDHALSVWPSIHQSQNSDSDLDAMWNRCNIKDEDRYCQNTVLMQYLLQLLQRSSGTDVALLERRDFYFDWLGREYSEYSVCDQWLNGVAATPSPGGAMPSEARQFYSDYCRLRVALDRVLWTGDLSDRVMLDGGTLAGLMKTAQQQSGQEQSLLGRDVHHAWLMTYGIVTKPPKNLVSASSGPEAFHVSGSENCNNTAPVSAGPPDPDTPPYCVNGQIILPDRAYSVALSDQLSEDGVVYSTLGSLDASAHFSPGHGNQLYVTTQIADHIVRQGQDHQSMRDHPKAHNAESAETLLSSRELLQQNRRLVQWDVGKLIAGFTFTHPSLNDSTLATDLSGVSNTQALTPHSQELDLQGASRLVFSPVFGPLILGAQSDAEFDRSVVGNLTGSPETVTYSANNMTVGGFGQIDIRNNHIPFLAQTGVNLSTRNLPRAAVVLAPYQFQRQITGTVLYFPFFSPSAASTSQQQATVHLPTVMGFSQRVGLRYEFGGLRKAAPEPGSYFEIGPEYTNQDNVLAGIKMPQLSPTAECPVSATQSIQDCVENAYKAAGATLDQNSDFIPVTQSLHTGGFYWNAHLQKSVLKQRTLSFSLDTQGDAYLLPGFTLPTQTRYALTTKLAVNFKIVGNLSFSPTYSEFFFENQGAPSNRTDLRTPTLTLAAKWFFARDASVPLRKQARFSGPGSVDQTSDAKVK